MQKQDEFEELKVDFLNEEENLKNLLEIENFLEEIDNQKTLKINVNDELEKTLQEIEDLKQQMTGKEADTLVEACKTSAMNTITSQFGLASLFIDSRDGGSVTTSHNFDKGITSNEADNQKYQTFKSNNDGSKKWEDVRKDVGYDKDFQKKRKEYFSANEQVIDAYTGKVLPKDGRTQLDHIVSAKEIESNSKNHLFLSTEERANMAIKDTNLAFTSESINKSKGNKKMKEFLDTQKKGEKVNKERYEIDEKKALEKDEIARIAIKAEVNEATFKKYSTELLQTGAKDAAKMALYSSLGVVLREFLQALFQTIKEIFANYKQESLKELFTRFKVKMQGVAEKLKREWKDIFLSSLEGAITAFFSNLLVFAINLFATTLKKLVSMIRAGFVSLVQAVKIMVNPPENITKEEAVYQAAKIMIAGLIGAASLGLAAAVEKFLQAIPGLQPIMMFSIPFLENQTVSDILAITLTSVLAGVVTTIVIYSMDKFRDNSKKSKLQIQLVRKSELIVEYRTIQSWFVLEEAYIFLDEVNDSTNQVIESTKRNLETSRQKVDKSKLSLEDKMQEMKKLIKR
ncbi:hypothetical protein FE246_03860 [Aliarcobacter thereius]|uniref:Uncharacterized protein n=1 Tax=Aliarcobacter thereius TaxID=544718 RepID=A0A5R9H8W4_9BACT|nr:hypothetical protein [Aliarcobacter thereius]TLS72532.1 hypothetical protein FE246_03860 [Aliarcobacter thereius]